MKRSNLFNLLLILTVFINACQNHKEQELDFGDISMEYQLAEMDTVYVQLPSFSENGFFRIENEWVYYFDPIFSTANKISQNGEVLKTYLGLGDSPSEIRQDFVWHGRLGSKHIFMGRASDIHVFTDEFEREEDFMYVVPRTKERYDGKKEVEVGTYDMDIVFNVLTSKNLAIDIYQNIYVPVRILPRVNPSYNLATDGYYNDAASIGRININSGKLETVFGNFPSEYLDHRWEHYDDRFITLKSDSIFVGYKGSFKIQVYSPFPENDLIYEFGQKEATINSEIKNFISFEETPYDSFKNGFYSHLYYDSINNLMFRSFIIDRESNKGGVQIYRNKDLVAQFNTVHKFNVIGYHNGFYYADGILNEEEDQLGFYKFKLNIK